MTKHYELTYTISKNLTPEEADALFDKIISYLPQATASEKKQDFFTMEFYAEPEAIEEINRKLKLESQIKNYMITKKEAFKIGKIRTRKMPAATPSAEQKVEKTDLKEIDQKLKEIFGE